MTFTTAFTKTALLCVCLSAALTLHASDKPPRQHKTPPQEAFDACTDKAEGDSCEVITPEQETLSGTCRMPPRQDQLVCAPHMNKRHPN